MPTPNPYDVGPPDDPGVDPSDCEEAVLQALEEASAPQWLCDGVTQIVSGWEQEARSDADEAADRAMENSQLVDAIVRDVCELPDRSSPEDQPDMMLVSVDELTGILTKYFKH